MGFPGGSMEKNSPVMQETLVWSLGWDDPLEPTPVFLPRKSHGQGSLVGYSPWGRKGQTRLSDKLPPQDNTWFAFSFY